jgi:hypothetical protein
MIDPIHSYLSWAALRKQDVPGYPAGGRLISCVLNNFGNENMSTSNPEQEWYHKPSDESLMRQCQLDPTPQME